MTDVLRHRNVETFRDIGENPLFCSL